jgi:hypothetical protein
MARNLMGFKKVDGIPTGISRMKGESIYAPLIDEALSTGGTYALDTKDRRRASNLATQLRKIVKTKGIAGLKVVVRYTTVYVCGK